jgi:hypothetical protein
MATIRPLGYNRFYPCRGYIFQPLESPRGTWPGVIPVGLFNRWSDLIPVGRPVADNSAWRIFYGGAKIGGHSPLRKNASMLSHPRPAPTHGKPPTAQPAAIMSPPHTGLLWMVDHYGLFLTPEGSHRIAHGSAVGPLGQLHLPSVKTTTMSSRASVATRDLTRVHNFEPLRRPIAST